MYTCGRKLGHRCLHDGCENTHCRKTQIQGICVARQMSDDHVSELALSGRCNDWLKSITIVRLGRALLLKARWCSSRIIPLYLLALPCNGGLIITFLEVPLHCFLQTGNIAVHFLSISGDIQHTLNDIPLFAQIVVRAFERARQRLEAIATVSLQRCGKRSRTCHFVPRAGVIVVWAASVGLLSTIGVVLRFGISSRTCVMISACQSCHLDSWLQSTVHRAAAGAWVMSQGHVMMKTMCCSMISLIPRAKWPGSDSRRSHLVKVTNGALVGVLTTANARIDRVGIMIFSQHWVGSGVGVVRRAQEVIPIDCTWPNFQLFPSMVDW